MYLFWIFIRNRYTKICYLFDSITRLYIVLNYIIITMYDGLWLTLSNIFYLGVAAREPKICIALTRKPPSYCLLMEIQESSIAIGPCPCRVNGMFMRVQTVTP